MNFSILGLGTAVPPHSMSQQEATELAQQVVCRTEQQQRLISVLYRKAGVENRYTALPHRIAEQWLPLAGANDFPTDRPPTLGPTTAERMQFFAEHAPPIALSASQQALDQAAMAPSEITHLVTVSCTGFDAPGVDTALIRGLGLRPTTQRIQVGFMGCHGAINGLRAAQAIAGADPTARVLLCAAELCSLHYRFAWDPERIIANALFADGAAAVVGAATSHETRHSWSVAATGSCLIPDSMDAMTWRIGDHGFEMTLHAQVPELIHKHLRPWLEEWLPQQGQSLGSIASWAIHPGGPRILSAIAESLNLPVQATSVSREILAGYGNMSSPTVLFIVNRLREMNAPRPCLALGFGPGMFAEAALLT
ncbi:MAG: type III polyketide synthase [Pirellulaceae bacterium]